MFGLHVGLQPLGGSIKKWASRCEMSVDILAVFSIEFIQKQIKQINILFFVTDSNEQIHFFFFKESQY